MSQTLLITDSDKMSDLYTLNLKMYVGTDVILKKGHEEAVELLDIHPGIDSIVVKASIGDERAALNIFKYLNAKDREIPMVVIGEEPAIPADDAIHLEEDVELKPLLKAVATVLGVTAQDMINKVVSEYVPVPIINFLHIENSVCDAYLRIKKSKGEFQYIKRVHANETIDAPDIEKYMNEGVENLFIPSDERLSFTNNVTTQIKNQMANPEISVEERSKVTDVAIQSVAQQMVSFGVNEGTIEFSEATMTSIMKQVEDVPKISKLLSIVLGDETSYMYRHTQVCTFICSHIVNNIDWGTREQAEKLAFVCFFHDITLVNEKLQKVRSEAEMAGDDFSFEEQEAVRNHAKSSIILLEKYPHMPIGADIIIKQHHGHKMGNGFPMRFSNDLSPLSMIYLVAQDLTDYIIDKHGTDEFDFKQFLDDLYMKYKLPKFIKSIDALKSLKL